MLYRVDFGNVGKDALMTGRGQTSFHARTPVWDPRFSLVLIPIHFISVTSHLVVRALIIQLATHEIEEAGWLRRDVVS